MILPRQSIMAGYLKTSFYSRNDLFWSFLGLQKLGQGISKGFQHSHMGGLETQGKESDWKTGRKDLGDFSLLVIGQRLELPGERGEKQGKACQGRDQGSTHLDAGSQGQNNALWQKLLSHGLALHDQIPQSIQTQLLRAGNESTGLGSSLTRPGTGGGGWHVPVLEAHREKT